MTKIYMYGVSDAEAPFIEIWKQNHPEIEVVTDTDILTNETVDRCLDADGVTTYQYAKVDHDVYAKLQENNIHNISQRMAGFDPFDLEEAKKRDIIITNVPAYSPGSIAEFAVVQMLNGLRHMYRIYNRSRQHTFLEGDEVRGSRLANCTVGIIGTGRIGREAARISRRGFGAKVLGYDVYQNEEVKSILEYRDTVEEIMEEADVISLHLPAVNDTIHMFNDEMFKHSKEGQVLVNVGRGALIDTPALLDALKEGRIGFAALDTYENEFDYVKHDWKDKEMEDKLLEELIARDDVSYTPHLAYYTDESVQNMVYFALQSTMNIIEEGDDENRVN